MARFSGEPRADKAPDEGNQAPASLLARLGWFVVYWIVSVSVLTVIAYAIRAVIL